ncbi:MAG TPA: ATP-binding protein [Microlunatus sp.]
MAGLSRPQDGAPTATTVATTAGPRLRIFALAIVLALGLIGLVLASGLPVVVRVMVGGVALVLSGIALAGACRYRYHRSAGRRRRAWLLFGCTALGAAAGNLWVTITELVDPGGPHVVGDLLLLGSLLLAVVALITYPSGPRRPIDVARVVLDGVVLAGSILLVLSNTLIPRIAEQPSLGSLTMVLAPIIDIVLVTVAWLMFLRSTGRDRPGLALAAAGFALFAVSDISASVRQSETGFTFGTVIDLGWIAGYTVLAIAVRWSPSTEAQQTGTPHRASPIAGTLLMFAVFFVAGSLTLWAVSDGDISTTVVILLGGVLIAITARQVLLLIDNEQLRANLEQRVIERSTELAEVTQRTDLLIDSVEDGVYGVDSQGRVTFVNPAGARLLGAGRGVLLGSYAHETFHSHPLADCYLRTIQRNALAITGIEDAYRTTDGRLVPVDVSASPMSEGTGVRGVVVVFRDVTRRREVDRMKNEFVSLVSHELKTPLTAIRGSLGLLAGGALGELAPAATRMVEIAMESSERLTRLINEILDMERIESGSMPMQIGSYDVASLLVAAHDQVRVLAADAGIGVHVDAASGRVLADADRVVQTMINLVGNAIKFSPPGSEVTLSAVPDGPVVVFTVRDQGRGVPENRLDVIFERFEQVDSSDAREKGGTGLGLSISRSIVERLGGRIWAANNVDGGSTFAFTLPSAPLADHDDLQRSGQP